MNKKSRETDARVKKKIMGWREFSLTYIIMLFLVGIQTGMLILPFFNDLESFVQVAVIMGYWAIVALAFSLITNLQIKQSYDKPMRKLSSAAKKVAEGDFFSVCRADAYCR